MRDRQRAQAARARTEELIDHARQGLTRCPACGERLGTSRGLLFQGDELVHAVCWQPPPAARLAG